MGYPIWNRRRFLRTAAGTAGFLAAMPYLNAAEALTDARPLKVGLVGCGGRGLGAMKNALDADPGTVVWALADVFRERIDFGSNLLTEQYGSRVQLDKSRLFDGLDGYKKLLQTDIDVVLLCTPSVRSIWRRPLTPASTFMRRSPWRWMFPACFPCWSPRVWQSLRIW